MLGALLDASDAKNKKNKKTEVKTEKEESSRKRQRAGSERPSDPKMPSRVDEQIFSVGAASGSRATSGSCASLESPRRTARNSASTGWSAPTRFTHIHSLIKRTLSGTIVWVRIYMTSFCTETTSRFALVFPFAPRPRLASFLSMLLFVSPAQAQSFRLCLRKIEEMAK